MDKTSVIDKVEALLAKADSTTFSEERDALLAKADALMLKYAIESYELGQKDASQREEVAVQRIRIVDPGSDLKDELIDLFHAVVLFARCRAVYSGLLGPKRQGSTATVVGFPSDIEYVRVLFASLHLQLMNDLEPKYDPTLSRAANIHALRSAGLKWPRVAEKCGIVFEREFDNMYAPLRKEYRTWCVENGEEPLSGAGKTYQRSYALGFVQEVHKRFSAIEKARAPQYAPGTSTALVLRDRSKEVDAHANDLFGDAKAVSRKASTFSARGWSRGKEAGGRADISGGRNTIDSRKALS